MFLHSVVTIRDTVKRFRTVRPQLQNSLIALNRLLCLLLNEVNVANACPGTGLNRVVCSILLTLFKEPHPMLRLVQSVLKFTGHNQSLSVFFVNLQCLLDEVLGFGVLLGLERLLG